MVVVEFYEKPGCRGNARQKQVLTAAGHHLQVHDLLREPWTAERLRPFFEHRPVADWFNPTAPAIAAGHLQPHALTADQALALMVAQPILIRRPLLQVGEKRVAGFDLPTIDGWIGLAPATDLSQNLQRCPQHQADSS